MRKIVLFVAVILVAASSCRILGKRVKGNGILTTQDRHVGNTDKVKLAGSYDVEITQGAVASVKVEADENILPYIVTEERNGYLVIKSRDDVNISTDNTIRVFITTAKLEEVHLAGSGNIIGKNKFTGGNKLVLKIAGSGDMQMEVNSPEIKADIAGSGSITLKGETREENIHISGVGNYNAEELKAETAKVRIAGSGDVKVFADQDLDINIAGMGSVYYKGAAAVKQRIAGSGEVKKIN